MWSTTRVGPAVETSGRRVGRVQAKMAIRTVLTYLSMSLGRLAWDDIDWACVRICTAKLLCRPIQGKGGSVRGQGCRKVG